MTNREEGVGLYAKPLLCNSRDTDKDVKSATLDMGEDFKKIQSTQRPLKLHRLPRIIWWPVRVRMPDTEHCVWVLVRAMNLSGVAHIICVGQLKSAMAREIEDIARDDLIPALIKAMQIAQIHRNKSKAVNWKVHMVHVLESSPAK